jgi:hypothetical protein
MTFEELRIGIEIFTMYEKKPDAHSVCAEHDQLWVCRVPADDMEPRHVQRLDEAGWFWCEDGDGWSHFT